MIAGNFFCAHVSPLQALAEAGLGLFQPLGLLAKLIVNRFLLAFEKYATQPKAALAPSGEMLSTVTALIESAGCQRPLLAESIHSSLSV